MAGRRMRGIRPEERRLWESYAEGVRPKLPERGPESENPDPPQADARASPSAPQPVPAFRIGEAARGRDSVAVARARPVREAPARMDNKTFGKMKKGRLKPDARIDLHGRTVDEAHNALIAFILSRQARGDRLVLVITGKGERDSPAPVERGILRRQAPHWLTLPPLSSAVLDVSPAHRRHGGDGAFYVYLRRLR